MWSSWRQPSMVGCDMEDVFQNSMISEEIRHRLDALKILSGIAISYNCKTNLDTFRHGWLAWQAGKGNQYHHQDKERSRHCVKGISISSGIDREYCNWETFTAQFNPGQVILMREQSMAEWNLTYDATGDPSVIGCTEDIIRYLVSHLDIPREYCNWETFSAQCKQGEVILMTTAKYGRMRLGRCVPETYDKQGNPSMTGCSENIIRYFLICV